RRIGRAVGEVRHGDQFEAAIEDAEYLVVLEVERVDVVGDVGVVRGVAEAQIAGAFVERPQVREDALAVARPERADRYPVALAPEGDFRRRCGARRGPLP